MQVTKADTTTITTTTTILTVEMTSDEAAVIMTALSQAHMTAGNAGNVKFANVARQLSDTLFDTLRTVKKSKAS